MPAQNVHGRNAVAVKHVRREANATNQHSDYNVKYDPFVSCKIHRLKKNVLGPFCLWAILIFFFQSYRRTFCNFAQNVRKRCTA